MKVLIKKLETRSDAEKPDAKLPSNYESVKEIEREDLFEKPKVSQTFQVIGIKSYFISSLVEEIIEDNETSGKFKTINSIYYWEILKEHTSSKDLVHWAHKD